MKKGPLINVSRTSIGALIGIIWTLVSALIFLGWSGPVQDNDKEKIYSIEMMVVGYFLYRRGQKDDNTEPGAQDPCANCP